ncbi:MAG: glycosyltransferase family 1 protein [Candidatus Uhrbacteria bacterium]
MPIIAIDASSAQKTQRTGVEEYSFQIIEGLKKMVGAEVKLILYFQNSLPALFVFHQEGVTGLVLNWPFKRFWQQLRVTWELWRRPPDIYFVPGQALPFFIAKKIKVATTIHDVGFARRPDLYPAAEVRRQRAATKRAVKRANVIFTPSEFTKNELINLFHARPEKVVVTPLAADVERFKPLSRETVEVVLNKYRLGYKNYLLFVGRVDRKKNPGVLLPAFEDLKKNMGQGDPLRLVFAGPAGHGFTELKVAAEKSTFKSFISFLDFVSTEDLSALINGAMVLLSPSWYEGFNLPLLEAAACGTPLIISDIQVHHEVVGQAAVFVPPNEPEKWLQVLTKAIREPALMAQLAESGLPLVKNFSWGKTAEMTFEALWKTLLEN